MPSAYSVMRAASLFLLIAISAVRLPFRHEAAQSPKMKDSQKPKPLTGHVILISISGLRADFANNPDNFRLRLPVMQSLRSSGGYAVGVESVYPTQMIPAHATIVTGTLPADHGVTSDFPFDILTGTQGEMPYRSVKEIRSETIWEYLRRGGLTTATVGFPLSIGAAINFNLHDFFPGESAADTELRNDLSLALNKKIDDLPVQSKADPGLMSKDPFNAAAASYLIEKYRPQVTMIHFRSFERAQQLHGLESQQAMAAIEKIDFLIGKIAGAADRAGIRSNTTMILLSDHGAAKVEHEFRPNVILARKGLLTANDHRELVSWRAMAQTYGGSAAIYVRNPQDEKFVQEIESLFTELHQKPDSPIWRVIPRRDAARLGADPRAVLYLDASPSYMMSAAASGSSSGKPAARSAHGYSPSRSDMRAALIVSGQGIKPGTKLEYARLIDIAPTIARLMGLEMKTARGRVLSEFLVE